MPLSWNNANNYNFLLETSLFVTYPWRSIEGCYTAPLFTLSLLTLLLLKKNKFSLKDPNLIILVIIYNPTFFKSILLNFPVRDLTLLNSSDKVINQQEKRKKITSDIMPRTSYLSAIISH